MLTLIAKLLKSAFSQSSSKKSPGYPGQVAIVLILVIAVLFIFFAVIMNLGRVSQIKTMTMLASNQSAAIMTSYMASYAQNYYEGMGGQEELDDDLTRCGWTALAKAFFGLILVVVSIVIFNPAPIIALGGMLLAMGGIILAPIIDQANMTLWNKIYHVLGSTDRFVETGLITGLQNAVNDDKRIDDTQDIDLDGIYGPTDQVSRFSSAYTQRLRELANERRAVKIQVIKDFQAALEEFLKKKTDNWGIWDPVWDTCASASPHACCSNNPPVSECNPCCLPNGTNGEPNYRPACCDAPVDNCGTSASCPFASGFPYVYDHWYENKGNGFVSLREYIGTDDENLWRRLIPPGPDVQYRPEDSTGVFPKFWDIGYRTILTSANYNPGTDMCYWCDSRYNVGVVNCVGKGGITLPNNCVPFGMDACCVSGLIAGGMTDRVTNVAPPNSPMLIRDNECFDPKNDNSWWKRGANRFCSSRWPYSANCPGQYCPSPPMCNFCTEPSYTPPAPAPEACSINDDSQCQSSADHNLWREDSLDEIRYGLDGLDGFINWAEEIIKQDATLIAATFAIWYPEVERWISINNSDKGTLLLWSEAINSWKTAVSDWRGYNGYRGQLPSDICFKSPAAGGPNNVTIPNVITCLESQRAYWANLQGQYNYWVGEYTRLTNLANQNLALYNNFMNCYNTCLVDSSVNSWIACNLACPAVVPIQTCSFQCWMGFPPPMCSFPSPPTGWGPEYCGSASPDNFRLQNGVYNYASYYYGEYERYLADAQTAKENYEAILPLLPRANNNAEKFRYRKDYLQRVYTESLAVVTTLNTAVSKFSGFLNDPKVKALRDEWDRINNLTQDLAAAPFAIYAWQSDPPEGRAEGYWHIVRADARLPGRCGGRCERQSPQYEGWAATWQWGEPQWPWPRRWDKPGGLKECVSLQDSMNRFANIPYIFNYECDDYDEYHGEASARRCFRGGTVKSRVIRFDENRQTYLSFANNIPFWRFVFHHPDQGEATTAEIQDMQEKCDPVQNGKRQGFFMVNGIRRAAEIACYDAVSKLVNKGVKSETCAEYFFHNRAPRGMSMKFSKCAGEF